MTPLQASYRFHTIFFSFVENYFKFFVQLLRVFDKYMLKIPNIYIFFGFYFFVNLLFLF